MRMASGRAPRIGRNNPPTIPGPRIANRISLPLDKKVAAVNIRYPYTINKNRFPITVIVHGRKPYVSSQASSAAPSLRNDGSLRGERMEDETPSEMREFSSESKEIFRLWMAVNERRTAMRRVMERTVELAMFYDNSE